ARPSDGSPRTVGPPAARAHNEAPSLRSTIREAAPEINREDEGPGGNAASSMAGQHLAQRGRDLVEMAVIDNKGRCENDGIADDPGQDSRLEDFDHRLIAALPGFLGRREIDGAEHAVAAE